MTSELRPAVEVASAVYDECREKGIRDGGALIKADREAVRAEQAAEVERLKKLIEATSAHFLRLNTDHPIMWEGAIDAAMEAVCLEVERQAAELAKFKALAETLAGVGDKVADAGYHGEECPMNTTGAYCNCGYDGAFDEWNKALRQYKEARDA